MTIPNPESEYLVASGIFLFQTLPMVNKKHKDNFDEVRFYYHRTIDSSQVRTSFDGIIELLNTIILPNSTNYSSCKETSILFKPLDNLMKNENKLINCHKIV